MKVQGKPRQKDCPCDQNYPIKRLPREACGFLRVKFQVHLLVGAGSPGRNQLPLLLPLGSRKPLAPDRFLPCISGRCFPIFSLLAFSDESICAAGDGIWHAGSDVKTLCPDVLIPCGNPLHHTWPPMAWFDKVNDYRATEVTYAHWSLQRAQEGPSPSFNAIKCFLFRNVHDFHAIFSPSPHNQPPLKPFSAAEPAFSWAQTLILSSRHFLQSLRGITAGKTTLMRRAAFPPTLWI